MVGSGLMFSDGRCTYLMAADLSEGCPKRWPPINPVIGFERSSVCQFFDFLNLFFSLSRPH